MAVFKMTEWQNESGLWYCNDVSNFAGGSGNWWNAARAWGKTPADFIEFLIKEYKPDKISYCVGSNLLIYAWRNQNNMRIFKNATNREARKRNFQI